MKRVAAYPIDPLFTERWSPRAMSGEPLPQAELNRLFEAARWAPSASNNQPWRFLYAHRDTAHFKTFFNLLATGNQEWCHQAAVLLVVVSKKTDAKGRPDRTHAFCTGSAWMNLALQASRMKLVAHGMAGFDYDRAKTELGIPDDYNVECMVAIGLPGNPADLPSPHREREQPNDRQPIADLTHEGNWGQTT